MVHLKKAFIVAAIVAVPAFAAPLQFGQNDIDLIARDPNFFGSIGKAIRSVNVGKIVKGVSSAYKKVAPVLNKVRSVVKTVAPVAAMIPGPIGAVGAVASAIARRDLDEALYTRAAQDELDARGYDIQLQFREIEGLDARDLSNVLQVRSNNVYTLAAREFIDSIEMMARRELADDLEDRELTESLDELD
jgi:hypothetical protein